MVPPSKVQAHDEAWPACQVLAEFCFIQVFRVRLMNSVFEPEHRQRAHLGYRRWCKIYFNGRVSWGSETRRERAPPRLTQQGGLHRAPHALVLAAASGGAHQARHVDQRRLPSSSCSKFPTNVHWWVRELTDAPTHVRRTMRRSK